MKDKHLISFYKSTAWKRCRDNYAKSVGGLCERCLKKNKIVAGKIVHHRIYLNPENVKNGKVALNWDNLELVCQDCHNKEHHKNNNSKRYRFDKYGNIQYLDNEKH